MSTDFYIKKIQVTGSKTKVLTQKLVDNGNANEFDTLLQTGDGEVTELTENTNNYSPTGWGKKKHFSIIATIPINITGYKAPLVTEPWKEVYFWNRGSVSITLPHDDIVNSDPKNCFFCEGSASIVLNPNDGCYGVYDPIAERYRMKK